MAYLLGNMTPAPQVVEPVQKSAGPDTILGLGAGVGQTTSLLDSLLARSNEFDIVGGERPFNLKYRMNNAQNCFWYPYQVADFWASNVSVMATLCHRLAAEPIRHGVEIVPRFALKCCDCGHETRSYVTRCPVCKGERLRKPDPLQKKYYERPDGSNFIDRVNYGSMSLTDLLYSFAEMEVKYNEGWILCVTGDVMKDGRLVKGVPLEFIPVDPKFVKILYDETGRPGRIYAYTKDDRSHPIDIKGDMDRIDTVTSEGKTLYNACWQVGENIGATGVSKFYSFEEMYHSHWFGQSLTYGFPHMFSIEDDLLALHYMEKKQAKKWGCGYVRKLLVLPGFSGSDVRKLSEMVHQQLSKDSNSIPVVGIPAQGEGFGRMEAQLLDIGVESASDLLAEKEEIIHRITAHWGVPNIFAGDANASGGMNDESQQITIMDRNLARFVKHLDDLLKWFNSWFPVTDWDLKVNNPASKSASQKVERDRLDRAQAMHAMGFEVRYVDGEFYFGETVDGAGGQSGIPNGLPGPNPTGLPPKDRDDRGTDRRENPEAAVTMEEVDSAKEGSV